MDRRHCGAGRVLSLIVVIILDVMRDSGLHLFRALLRRDSHFLGLHFDGLCHFLGVVLHGYAQRLSLRSD
jgi:hypothetical protein